MKRSPKRPLVALLVLLFLIGSCQGGEKSAPATEGQGLAPDFALPALTGETLRLSDFKGEVVILNFWATRCPPCRIEIPHFIKLYDKYREEGLAIIGINLDGNINQARQFSEKMGISYPVAVADRKAVTDYGPIRYIPTTFIIDRKGTIKEKYIGYNSYEVFENAIKPLLNEDTLDI